MYKRYCWASINQHVNGMPPNTTRYINSSVTRNTMNFYYSIDIFFNIWDRPEFPVRRSTHRLDHDLFPDPADVCLQSAIKWHFYGTRNRAKNEDPSHDPRSVPAPDHFTLASLTAVVDVAAWSWQRGSWQPYSVWGAVGVRSSRPSTVPVQLKT